MSSELSKSRRVLVEAIKGSVFPELRLRAFSEISRGKEPGIIGNFSRLRADGGYDVISLDLDEKKRPQFHAIIGCVDAKGLIYPWGESIPANQVTALFLLTRVFVQKRGRGVLSLILPRWFGHAFFGFTPREDAAFNQQAAVTACAEFVACLDQAERWWRTGELGPNLVEASMVLRDPNTGNTSVAGAERKESA